MLRMYTHRAYGKCVFLFSVVFVPGSLTLIQRQAEQMQIHTNWTGDRRVYEYPYGDSLTSDEEAVYWSATKKAEDAIARISRVQETRTNDNGDFISVLLSDELQELEAATSRLSEAITVLSLVERPAEWTDQKAQRQSDIYAKSVSNDLSSISAGVDNE